MTPLKLRHVPPHSACPEAHAPLSHVSPHLDELKHHVTLMRPPSDPTWPHMTPRGPTTWQHLDELVRRRRGRWAHRHRPARWPLLYLVRLRV
eukprot:3826885-Prymnesium_polylepis.1